MDKSTNVGTRPGDAEGPQKSGTAAPGCGGRMSRQRKMAAVLRLLRGEDLELVSRSLGVTTATLTTWRDAFLAAGEAALTTKPTTGEELESERLKARLVVALIERDLLNEKITILEATALWPCGGSNHERRRLAGQRQVVWAGGGLSRLAPCPIRGLSPSGSAVRYATPTARANGVNI